MRLRPDWPRLALSVVLGACVCGCTTCRLPAPAGGEARVNTTLPGDQSEPAAAQSGRAAVVVWTDGGALDAGRGVFGQRLDACGRPTGGEFRIDAAPGAPGAIVRVPDVAMNASGASVVAWESVTGPEIRVFARRYGPDGRALGDPVEVSTVPTTVAAYPAVAMDTTGRFVVVWQSHGHNTGTEIDDDIFARRYTAMGDTEGGALIVNSSTVQNQTDADVAMGPGGAFVVTWFDYGANGEADVFARRYHDSGAAGGDAFRVHASSPLYQSGASVAMDTTGAFVVAWQTARPDATDIGIGISAQRFNAVGTSVDGVVPVSPAAEAPQGMATVAVDADGDAVVVWQRAGAAAGEYDVLARHLGAAGRVGVPFRVNERSTGILHASAVAVDAGGNVLVVWGGLRTDGKNRDVYARRYRRQ